MRKAMIALPMVWILGVGAFAGPEEAALLPPGEYQVTIRLELPHVEEAGGATKSESICVTPSGSGTHGLVVLSDSNPLRNCPVSNVHRDGDKLTFDIACAGSDAAIGVAKYAIRAEGFEGAITVKMGGKNMTMIERQSGRRVGGCNSKPSGT